MPTSIINQSDIRAAWVTLFKKVVAEDGYNFTIQEDSIFHGANDPTQGDIGDKNMDMYPLANIDLEMEDYSYGASNQIFKDSIWILGFAVIPEEGDDSKDALVSAMDKIVYDIEKLIFAHPTMLGLARMVRILQTYCDTGLNNYEGICLMRVLVQYRARVNS